MLVGTSCGKKKCARVCSGRSGMREAGGTSIAAGMLEGQRDWTERQERVVSGICHLYERAVDERIGGRLFRVSESGWESATNARYHRILERVQQRRGRVLARTILSHRILSWVIFVSGSVYFQLSRQSYTHQVLDSHVLVPADGGSNRQG